MRNRRIALLAMTGLLSACASSGSVTSEIRTVRDRQELAGCTKVGILPESALRTSSTSVSGELERRVQAQVTNLGGNTVVVGSTRAPAVYEVWSCPVEAVEAPR